jgi:hypothetical protein
MDVGALIGGQMTRHVLACAIGHGSVTSLHIEFPSSACGFRNYRAYRADSTCRHDGKSDNAEQFDNELTHVSSPCKND